MNRGKERGERMKEEEKDRKREREREEEKKNEIPFSPTRRSAQEALTRDTRSILAPILRDGYAPSRE